MVHHKPWYTWGAPWHTGVSVKPIFGLSVHCIINQHLSRGMPHLGQYKTEREISDDADDTIEEEMKSRCCPVSLDIGNAINE